MIDFPNFVFYNYQKAKFTKGLWNKNGYNNLRFDSVTWSGLHSLLLTRSLTNYDEHVPRFFPYFMHLCCWLLHPSILPNKSLFPIFHASIVLIVTSIHSHCLYLKFTYSFCGSNKIQTVKLISIDLHLFAILSTPTISIDLYLFAILSMPAHNLLVIYLTCNL